MSGHSKWSTIKRKKGALDAKRGKIFSRLAKEITVAAKIGGGDPSANPRLRTVLNSAKSANMPNDNIDRAIKKGTGELPGVTYEDSRYECYGAAGVGIIVDILTDNKRRTVAEIRHLVNKYNGSMAENGAVSWNFEEKGIITLPKDNLGEEEVFDKAIEAGAEDVDTEGDWYEITTEPTELHTVSSALEDMGYPPEEAKLTMLPKTTIEVESNHIRAVLNLLDSLEDNDDVQDVYHNLEMSDAVLAEVMAE